MPTTSTTTLGQDNAGWQAGYDDALHERAFRCAHGVNRHAYAAGRVEGEASRRTPLAASNVVAFQRAAKASARTMQRITKASPGTLFPVADGDGLPILCEARARLKRELEGVEYVIRVLEASRTGGAA